MSVTVFQRPARRQAPTMPGGELALQEPPVLPEMLGSKASSLLMMLPMVVALGAMFLIVGGPALSGGGGGVGLSSAGGGLMLMSMMVMGIMRSGGRGAGERSSRLRGERRDYLRYLTQMRGQVRTAADEQRSALMWRHPDPQSLWSLAMSGRLWERRVSHPDFAEIRIAIGPQPLALELKPLRTKPIEDLEPLSARALRRFIAAYSNVADLPSALFLRGFANVRLCGDEQAARGLLRAVVAQLITFHSPDTLTVAVCASAERLPDWDWVKWLPHAQHGTQQDGAGSERLLTSDMNELHRLLISDLGNRGRFEAGATPSTDEPYTVILVDGVSLPAETRLSVAGFSNCVLIGVGEDTAVPDGRNALRLDVSAAALDMVRTNRVGKEVRTALGRPDSLSRERITTLARTMSAYRLAANTEAVESMMTDFDLPSMLGVNDVGDLQASEMWRRTAAPPDRLRVPIGVAEDGSRVELDLKEAAQGGMGPHGLLIGATGSGKSELLRTLVLALAMTHSSEVLNFVLTDFKGGATFLGLDSLPHTSAVITNLADEEALVGRMQDALQGEMMRRQELLRSAGNYSSLLDYEKARLSGVPLAPLPTLFVVVDEFSELLASHPDFAELFVMIGRLGRSLGVHLLLASQRLDDGRMHKLESHLSYRISLRTFSAMESRSVIGVPDAYQLPNAPGNGYIRTDVSTLVRFKAAYVSGRYQRRTREERQEEVRQKVVVFAAGHRAQQESTPRPEVTDDIGAVPDTIVADGNEQSQTLLKVAVGRLLGKGPPAHRVWLPPLIDAPTLDQVLPPLVPDPDFGLTPIGWAGRGQLVVPIGLIDKPFEQLRDLYMLDMSGVGGHVGIAGGPQSGKSTLTRSIIAALALTHTAEDVQFYCLDFGGGSLSTLGDLPHVGGIAGRNDRERVGRTVSEVAEVLTHREQAFAELGVDGMPDYRRLRTAGTVDDPFGDVFLVVDGWASLRSEFEDEDTRIRHIAARGLAYGVHLILTSGRWSDIHSSLRDLLGSRIELRLGDSIDSMIDIRAAAKVPRSPGHGLTMDKLDYLATVPRIDGQSRVDNLSDATRALASAVSDHWAGRRAPNVRLLPAVVPGEQLPPPRERCTLPLGLAERDLEPVWHNFDVTPHLTVLGDTGSGKSAVLRLVAQGIVQAFTPDEAELLVVDSRRMLLDAVPEDYRRGVAFSATAATELVEAVAEQLRPRLPGPEVTPSQLARRDWWSGRDVFILVDDYDLLGSSMGGPLDALIDLLPQASDIGLHVVLTRAAAGSSRTSMDGAIRRLQESNTPDLVLSCPPNEMSLLNGMRPRLFPPGRGMVVTRRSANQVQVGWLEPASLVGA